MSQLYNPHQMTERQLADTFVGREAIVERTLCSIVRQPEGAGVQHVLIVGPRGIGKTTLLRIVEQKVKTSELNATWHVVRFPEEMYSVTDLADLWLETLNALARESSDSELTAETSRIFDKYSASDGFADAVFALIRDWSRNHHRRLLLLVDNLGLILQQLGNERESAALRNALMNDGTFMIVGTATSVLREVADYDQALYNFFRNRAPGRARRRRRARVDDRTRQEQRSK